jgi:hypothetical protein
MLTVLCAAPIAMRLLAAPLKPNRIFGARCLEGR